MLVLVPLLSVLVVQAAPAEELPRDAAALLAAYDEEILAQLEALAPDAVEPMRRGNAAQQAGDHAAALEAYGDVLALVPDFVHAKRRSCSAHRAAGEIDTAIARCREALESSQVPENQVALAIALATSPDGSAVTPERIEESKRLAKAAYLHDDSVLMLLAVCQATLLNADTDLLTSCSKDLVRDAPHLVESHVCAFYAAGLRGDLESAGTALEDARQHGLDPQTHAALSDALRDAQPLTARWGPLVGFVFLGWLFGLLVFLLTGWLLSVKTLRVARAVASDGQTLRVSAGLRRWYTGVLWFTCAYYYVSLPIVFVAILIVGAGALYAMMAMGYISIQLVIIIAVVMFVPLWGMLKGLFVRHADEDPGERLSLDEHARLKSVLEEVAAKVGTPPVDNVYLTAGTDIAVMERGGILKQLSGRNERCLILGVGVLGGMTLGQFEAIVAHEYGHLINEDTAGGGFALAVRSSLFTMAQTMIEGGAATWYSPGWWFINGFYRVFLRVSQGASRLQEILADRRAVLAYGAEPFAAGLRHAIAASIRFDAHADATLGEVMAKNRVLSNFYSYRPTEPVDESTLASAIDEALTTEASAYDSHPRPADRIAWAHAIAASPEPALDSDVDAWTVFEDREALEVQMTEQIKTSLRAAGVELPDSDAASG